MPIFDIKFNSKTRHIEDRVYLEGEITIGDYIERFFSSTDTWNKSMYQHQWKEGIARLKEHEISCLIMGITTLSTNPRIVYCGLYKKEAIVYFQPKPLMRYGYNELARDLPPFNKYTCYQYICTDVRINKKGGGDEWSLPLETVLKFLD